MKKFLRNIEAASQNLILKEKKTCIKELRKVKTQVQYTPGMLNCKETDEIDPTWRKYHLSRDFNS